MPENLEIVGLSELNVLEKAQVSILLAKYKGKIKRMIDDITSIKIHLKKYKKSGHTSKYSLHVKVFTPKKTFEVEKADWNITKSLRKSFEALVNEIEHYINSRK